MNEPDTHSEGNNDAESESPRLFPEGFFNISRSIDKPQRKDEEKKPANDLHPRLKRNFWERLRFAYLRWWGRLSRDKRIEILLALAIVIFSYEQWHTAKANNASTTQQTDQLITAAKISAQAARENSFAAQKIADASERNAKAAESFAASAGQINAGVGGAVEKLQAQVQALEDARKSSEVSAKKSLEAGIEQFRRDHRPIISVDRFEIMDNHTGRIMADPQQFRVGEPLAVNIIFKNIGKSTALSLQPRYHLLFGKYARNIEADPPETRKVSNDIEQGEERTVTAFSLKDLNGGSSTSLNPADAVLWDGNGPIIVFGRFTYWDADGTTYCTPFVAERFPDNWGTGVTIYGVSGKDMCPEGKQ